MNMTMHSKKHIQAYYAKTVRLESHLNAVRETAKRFSLDFELVKQIIDEA